MEPIEALHCHIPRKKPGDTKLSLGATANFIVYYPFITSCVLIYAIEVNHTFSFIYAI